MVGLSVWSLMSSFVINRECYYVDRVMYRTNNHFIRQLDRAHTHTEMRQTSNNNPFELLNVECVMSMNSVDTVVCQQKKNVVVFLVIRTFAIMSP